MSPLEFMEKLVALIPRPKIHLTRFYGVLASHYKYRKEIVPKPTPPLPLPGLAGGTELAEQLPSENHNLEPTPLTRSKRYSWARLLKRVFQIDVSKCNKCGGNTKIIASIEKPEVIEKILSHLKLPTNPPILYPERGARGPPTGQNESVDQNHHHRFPQEDPQEIYSGLFHHFPQEIDQLFYQTQD